MADIDLPAVGSSAWGTKLNDALIAINDDLETRPEDGEVVHTTGDEAIAGTKTFSNGIVIPDESLPLKKVTGLTAALAEASSSGGGGIGVADETAGQVAIDYNGQPALGSRDEGVTSGALASGDRSVAIGGGTTEAGLESVAIGTDATSLGPNTVAVGESAAADQSEASAYGARATATADSATAVGAGSTATQAFGTAVGRGTTADAQAASAFGSAASANGARALAAGSTAWAKSQDSVALGANTKAQDQSATALGDGSVASGADSAALGSSSNAVHNDSIAIRGTSYGAASTALGVGSQAVGADSIAMGVVAKARADYATAVGEGADVNVRERALFAARDLEVRRTTRLVGADASQSNPTYGSSLETGLILTDSAGVRWRVTVNSSGVLQVAAPAASWDQVYGTALSSAGALGWGAVTSSADGTFLAAGVMGGYIWTSADSGATWTQRTPAGSRSWTAISCSDTGATIAAVYAGTGSIYVSKDSGATWAAASSAGSRGWEGVTVSGDGTTLVAWTSSSSGYLYRSTDGGTTWSQTASTGRWQSVSISPSGAKIVAARSSESYLSVSTDAGATWGPATPPVGWDSSAPARVKIVAGNSATLGHADSSVWASIGLTSNDGATWADVGSPRGPIGSMCASDNLAVIAIALGEAGVYRSTDSGSSWSYVNGTAGQFIYSLACSSDGKKMVMARGSGLHRMTFA